MKTRIKITNDKKALLLYLGSQVLADYFAGRTLLADVIEAEVLVTTELETGYSHRHMQNIATIVLCKLSKETVWLAPHLFEILPTKKVFRRGNLRVELDRDEVYPDDPGAGTPAMVYWKSKFVGEFGEYSATYNYAIGEGELESRLETRRLTDKQHEWLDSLADKIDEFLG